RRRQTLVASEKNPTPGPNRVGALNSRLPDIGVYAAAATVSAAVRIVAALALATGVVCVASKSLSIPSAVAGVLFDKYVATASFAASYLSWPVGSSPVFTPGGVVCALAASLPASLDLRGTSRYDGL